MSAHPQEYFWNYIYVSKCYAAFNAMFYCMLVTCASIYALTA